MDINLSISPAPSVIQKLAIRVYAASAPSVVVAVQEFNPPHTSPRNVSFTGLNPVVYIVNTYETPGDPVLGTLRHSFIYDPSFKSAETKDPAFITFTGGETSYSDASWAGWEFETIDRASSGVMFNPAQYTPVLNGLGEPIGFQLSQIGDEFAAGEQVTVTFQPKIATFEPIVVSSKFVTDERIITATGVNLTALDAGKLIRVASTSDQAVDLGLPALASTPNFSMFTIASEGGSQVTVSLSVVGGGNIAYGGNRTVLHLGKGERAWVIKTTGDYVVVNDINGLFHVGTILDCYDKDATMLNTATLDGSLLDRNVYRRLWAFVQQLDVSMVVTDAAWNTGDDNKAKFSLGDGTTTFRVPRLYTAGVAKAVDGSTRMAGTFEAGKVGDHKHIMPSIGADNPGSGLNGYGTIAYVGSSARFAQSGSGPRDLVSLPTNASGVLLSAPKNLVDNYGVYKLICI